MSRTINVGKIVPQKGIDYFDGVDGTNGKSLEFNWEGTQLGIRQEGQQEYQYQNLKGETGSSGENGRDGVIQYTAGDNITIENDVISASVPQIDLSEYKKTFVITNNSYSSPFIIKGCEEGIYYFKSSNAYVRAFSDTSTYSLSIPTGWIIITNSDITKNPSSSNYEIVGIIGGIYTQTQYDGKSWGYTCTNGELSARQSDGKINIASTPIYLMSSEDAQSVRGIKKFETLPETTIVPTKNEQFVNKKYVDDSINLLPAPVIFSLRLEETSISDGYYNYTNATTLSNCGKVITDIFALGVLNPIIYLCSKQNNTSFLYKSISLMNTKTTMYTFKSDVTTSSNSDIIRYGRTLTIYGSWDNNTFTCTALTADGGSYIYKQDYLAKDNVSSYTPTQNYHPATKKYVDDAIAQAIANLNN